MMFLELLLTVCFAMEQSNDEPQRKRTGRGRNDPGHHEKCSPLPQENNSCGEKNDDTKTDWQYENGAREEQPIKSMEKGSDREKEPSKICSGHALLQTEKSPRLCITNEQRAGVMEGWPGHECLKDKISYPRYLEGEQKKARIMDNRSFFEQSLSNIFYGHALLQKK